MRTKLTVAVIAALLCFLVTAQWCLAHDISIFDVGTRITLWVSGQKIQFGFLVELKNFPAQDERKNCDLNKDMSIDEGEREYYLKERCKRYIANLHVKVNGAEVAKSITKTEVFGIIGDVDRNAFSTYIEADVELDLSLYRVKIEYVNDNFRNEEPEIINDVNISVNRELDNLNIYPITPIVQYLDRELSDHLFMEMTLKRQFFIEFGCKDIGVKQEPFAANDIMLTKDSGVTSRKAAAGTPAPVITGSSQSLYKWLSDFTMTHVENAIKAKGISAWAWLILIGIFVGLIHVMIPGHGKMVIASYVVATHSTVRTAVGLALLITLVHTLSTIVLAAFIMILAQVCLPTTVQNVAVIYLAFISGGLVTLIGVYMLLFFKPAKWVRDEKKEELLVIETLDTDGARKSGFSLMWKVALATGIIPCITSSYAATLFIAYREYLKAFLMIIFIAVGQAITLSIIGSVAVGFSRGFRWAAAKEKGGYFLWLFRRVHKPTAVVLILLGLYGISLGWRFLAATKASAQPMTAEQRIEAYEKTLEVNPEEFDAHFNLGLLYAAKDELQIALGHFSRASQAKPDDLSSLRFLGHALTKQEKYEEALKYYRTALALSPQDENLLFNMAYIEDKLDREDEALKHYEQATEVNPGNAKALFNLGLIYDEQARLDEALKYYLAAAEKRPDDAAIQMVIANTCRNKKEYEKAVEHLLIVRKASPASKKVNLLLANIYLRRLEQEEKAQAFVAAYLENGGREEIEEALKALQKEKVTTPSFMKWDPPESAKLFEKFGACAVPFLAPLAVEQTGEQLKTTLAALAATEAPRAIPSIITALKDRERWSEADLYVNYGPDLEPPPVHVIAKDAFHKCMRASKVPTVARELICVLEWKDNRDYFLRQLYFDECLKHPFTFMDALLELTNTQEKGQLQVTVELALSLKGEALAMSDDIETARAFASYVKKWWKENRDNVVWDKLDLYFRRKQQSQ